MTRHCSDARSTAAPISLRQEIRWTCEQPIQVASRFPLRAGWHRLRIAHLDAGETVELRLDFGLGFVGHHSIRAESDPRGIDLFVRLFKPLRAVRLHRRSDIPGESVPIVSVEKVPMFELWWRRVREEACLLRRSASRIRVDAGPHDEPRRLWRWKGLQAFPARLAATGKSSYALWHQVHCPPVIQPDRPLKDWLLVMDCREGAFGANYLDAFRMAARHVGAEAHVLRDGDSILNLSQVAARASWVVLVAEDVLLDASCIAVLRSAVRPEAAVIYSDNDCHDVHGGRFLPQFRSSFSYERLKSDDWLGKVVAFRMDALKGEKAKQFNRYALSRAIAEYLGPKAFVHVPRILYSTTPPPVVQRAPPRGLAGGKVGASVIIPTRNRVELLQRCVDSVVASTRSHPPEIIIYDNGSDDPATLRLLAEYAARPGMRVLRDERPFNFSLINNEAAAIARGDVVVFLNNDTEVLSPDWIERLAEIATDPGVGCAGPLLLRPDGRVQHAGLVTGPGGVAGHLYAGRWPSEADTAAPLIQRDVSALTGACLAIEKSKFLKAGGFDSEGLPVAFNDVDLCLRLEQSGLRNIFVPDVRLVHLGSATREDDDFTTGSDRFRAEFRLMRERWGPRLDFDPYFPEHMRLTNSVPELRLA
jgi:O-antigen biosynthesis protein